MPILALIAFGVAIGATLAAAEVVAIGAILVALVASVIVMNRKG